MQAKNLLLSVGLITSFVISSSYAGKGKGMKGYVIKYNPERTKGPRTIKMSRTKTSKREKTEYCNPYLCCLAACITGAVYYALSPHHKIG